MDAFGLLCKQKPFYMAYAPPSAFPCGAWEVSPPAALTFRQASALYLELCPYLQRASSAFSFGMHFRSSLGSQFLTSASIWDWIGFNRKKRSGTNCGCELGIFFIHKEATFFLPSRAQFSVLLSYLCIGECVHIEGIGGHNRCKSYRSSK